MLDSKQKQRHISVRLRECESLVSKSSSTNNILYIFGNRMKGFHTLTYLKTHAISYLYWHWHSHILTLSRYHNLALSYRLFILLIMRFLIIYDMSGIEEVVEITLTHSCFHSYYHHLVFPSPMKFHLLGYNKYQWKPGFL